jgi:capsular exopolysaccharide synthesis family protein
VLGVIGRDPKIPTSPLVMYGAPHTPLAEAFRQLRTNVQFVDVDRERKVILVSSATAGEGRTTTVCNLGLAVAEAGARVLIVDADLRDPSVAQCLSIDGTRGLTDVLLNQITIERAIQPIGPTLDVLPSGPLPPNPSELLGSNRMVKLLAMLRGRYDVILIDAAPLLPVTDAAVLAPRVDGVLVLVRHGKTVLRDLQAAKDALHAVSGRVLGSVMTMVPHIGSRSRRRAKVKGRHQPGPLGQVPADEPTRSDPTPTAPITVPARDPARSVTPDQPSESADANGQVLDRGGSAAR